MSRLRKFDRKILWNNASDDNELSIGPLDTEEQEALIQRFELTNRTRNKRYVNILSLCYMVSSGVFLLLASKTSGKERALLVLCTQSIICSMINVRYELLNDFTLFRTVKLHLENSTLQKLNCVLIVLIEWLVLTHYEGATAKNLFVQLPLIMFIAAILIRLWYRDISDQINHLRAMKYRYKNA